MGGYRGRLTELHSRNRVELIDRGRLVPLHPIPRFPPTIPRNNNKSNMDTSLPYDRTPSPPESPSQPPQDSKITRIDPLDQPLDSYTQPIPSHVQSLLGRMGQGKVYLLEESPAILMTNSEGRIKNSVGSLRSWARGLGVNGLARFRGLRSWLSSWEVGILLNG